MTLTLLLLTTIAAGFPYPSDWNPNAKPEVDGTCASKYRGRQFVCTTTNNGTKHVEVLYVDRLPPSERPGAYDLEIPAWGMTCVCGNKGTRGVTRNDRTRFICNGGSFIAQRGLHSDFKGAGIDGPFPGVWTTKCDDFDY